MRTLFKKLFCIFVGVLAGSTLYAQNIENNKNAYVGAFDYKVDHNRDLASDFGFLAGGELPISERWSLALEYWNVEAESRSTAFSTDLKFYRIGYNYHLNMSNDWQPYISAGVGKFKGKSNAPGAVVGRDGSFDLGVGVKRYLSENVFLRGDVKMIKAINDRSLDFAASLALGYSFGRAAPAAATMVPAQATPRDSDGDGVLDNVDSCRNTSRGTAVDRRGCELDSDRDGVVDSRDNCPNTSIELAVDRNGCSILESAMMHQTLEVRFDTDQAAIKAEFNNEIEEFAVFMRAYSNAEAVIEGHTDSIGETSYNQALSERRANAVMNELIDEYNVSRSRLSIIGYGEANPVAPNNTATGRASNRRIDAEVNVEVETEQSR